MKPIRLIVNGDDFGISQEVNFGIIRAFQKGALTSCSLMVGGQAFDHAVQLAKENQGLAVGLHIVTVQGKSVLPWGEIPAIVNKDNSFSADPVSAGFRYYFSGKARAQIEKELAAQFEKFSASGLELSHIDSHLHMHVHPVIFHTLVGLGVQYGIRRMRVPEDDLRLSLSFDGRRWLKQSVDRFIFAVLCRKMKQRLRTEGFTFTHRVHGHFMSGWMSEDYVLRVLKCLGSGDHEIYFHPAMHGGGPKLNALQLQGLRELDILLSEKVKELMNRRGIRLTTYKGIEADNEDGGHSGFGGAGPGDWQHLSQ